MLKGHSEWGPNSMVIVYMAFFEVFRCPFFGTGAGSISGDAPGHGSAGLDEIRVLAKELSF